MHRRNISKRATKPLVSTHLRNISRALLEGDKRVLFLDFLHNLNDRRGIYALYDKKARLYYAGKASDLPVRLDNHLKDKHAEAWDRMTLFFLTKSANISEVEGILLATLFPKGNQNKPHLGQDMLPDLRRYLMKDAAEQIGGMLGSKRKESTSDLDKRITAKKLKSIHPQSMLAKVLGITPGRVSQLKNEEKDYRALLRTIKEGGHRDKVLLLLEKSKRKEMHTHRQRPDLPDPKRRRKAQALTDPNVP